jgi:hypothetical protein
MRRFAVVGARAASANTDPGRIKDSERIVRAVTKLITRTGQIRSPEPVACTVGKPITVTDTTSVGDDRLRRHVVEQSRHFEIVSIRRRYEFASLR